MPDTDADPRQIDRYRVALIDYATTSKGAANLWSVVATYPPRHRSRIDLERVFRAAVKLRQEREDIYTAWKAANGGSDTSRDMLDDENWEPGTGARCHHCGQYTSKAAPHTCPFRLAALPKTAPTAFACKATGATTAQVDLMGELPDMTVGQARDILSELTNGFESTDVENRFEELVTEEQITAAALNDQADPDAMDVAAFADDPVDSDAACGDTVRRYITTLAEGSFDEHMAIAENIGEHVDLRAFEGLQSAVKADTVSAVAHDIHRIDPSISRDRAEQIAHDAIRGWALNYSYSSDSSDRVTHFHQAAKALSEGRNPMAEHPSDSNEYEAAVTVVAQYRRTQQYFADRGITAVRVHRGISFYDGDTTSDDHAWGNITVERGRDSGDYQWVPPWLPAEQLANSDEQVVIDRIDAKPLSSWSDREEVATMFARDDERHLGYVLSTTVPVERILSTPRTGNGCLVEREYVLIDGPGTYIVRPDR